MSDLRETEICLLGQHKLDDVRSYVKCYMIKVTVPEACPPPSYSAVIGNFLKCP